MADVMLNEVRARDNGISVIVNRAVAETVFRVKWRFRTLLFFGSALISERGSVSRSTSPLQIKPLRVTDPRSVFKLSHYLFFARLDPHGEL
jgi:hypothetical protein